MTQDIIVTSYSDLKDYKARANHCFVRLRDAYYQQLTLEQQIRIDAFDANGSLWLKAGLDWLEDTLCKYDSQYKVERTMALKLASQQSVTKQKQQIEAKATNKRIEQTGLLPPSDEQINYAYEYLYRKGMI
jgi:hypothetical protein